MKKDLLILFLILFGVFLLLGEVKYLVSSDDKMETLSLIFNPERLWLNFTFLVGVLSFGLSSFYILSIYYPFKTRHRYLLFFGLALILSIAFRYFLEEILGHYVVGHGNYVDGTNIGYYFLDNCFFYFQYGAIAITYFFVKYSFKREQEKKDLIIENKATQLQLLKSQVNPHFLFNSLNNIYSLVHQKSENALPAIDRLSSLLRYSLYEVDQKVTLSQELDQIASFIELHKLKSKNRLNYNIETNSIDQNINVPAMLFFPLVENAFKHGDAYSEEHPMLIDICQKEKALFFSVSNLVKKQEKDEFGGIGLANIEKRLRLMYNDNHTFTVDQQNQVFKVLIQIPI